MDFPTLNQMVLGVPKLQMEHEEVCKGYALGKNVKKSFPCSESRSKEILDLVDFYVCGWMPMKFLQSYFYYVTFIDNFSCKTCIYFMKTKEEVFKKFQEFKVEVENLKGKKINILRLRNRGEYTSKELISFCK